ncbi:MAG: cell division protein FtsL [Gammaproteobacteria bacterium]|nr:cell division protein FtsL [Gammaproteobacteria bacterium]
MARYRVGVILLALAVAASALGVVYTKHRARGLFIELQSMQRDRDHMEVEWGRLQLELATLANPGYVERIAHEDRGMRVPDPDEVRILWK